VNLSFFIARKYFFSGKKKTFINVISIISMLVVGISTMALVIVLSVFNGLEGLLRNLYGSFDAEITVAPARGKTFEYTGDLKSRLDNVPGIATIAEVIEDNALIKYKGTQRVVRLKGVSEAFLEQDRFQQSITEGKMKLKEDSVGYAIVGRGIKYFLSIQLNDHFHPLQFYYPQDISPGQINPGKMFNLRSIKPGGIFAIEKYYDEKYVFVPIEFTQELLGYRQERTALEIETLPTATPDEVTASLQKELGSTFQVLSNEEVHGDLYKILQWEKIFVFLTFGVIIAIGSVNIYFSLSMLVIDKKKDLAVLQAMGAPGALLRKIFLAEGCIIAFSGGLTGLLLGLLISWLQQTFGLVGIGVSGAISQAYPVKIEWLDVALTVFFIAVVTVLAAIQPARKASKMRDLSLLQ